MSLKAVASNRRFPCVANKSAHDKFPGYSRWHFRTYSAPGVAGREFLESGHTGLVEQDANECRACHGQNGAGTILSSMFRDNEL